MTRRHGKLPPLYAINVGAKAREKLVASKSRLAQREVVVALARAINILADVRTRALLEGGPGWPSIVGACDVAEQEIRFAASKLGGK